MTYLTIHPDYAQELANAGFHTAEHLLRLESVIFCGHPGRNVARASIVTQSRVLRLLIKREHSVPLRERLVNLAGGFGLASKSRREAMTLTALQAAGITVPEWIAHGEDQAGCAFLVLRECTGAVDMRAYCARATSKAERLRWASILGRELAAIHEAGFDHPDLYSKHILVRENGAVCFIDWQRTGSRKRVGCRARIRALARLNATLDAGLATPKERLVCLAAYSATCRQNGTHLPDLHSLSKAIDAESVRIGKRRRLRELSQVRTNENEPRVIWRNGEALCLTSEFEACLGGNRPAWLDLDSLPATPPLLKIQETVEIADFGPAHLTRRRTRFWAHLMNRLVARHRPSSPELREAGFLFRLERLGLPVPRVLAFGQRVRSHGRLESFILQSRAPGNRDPRTWLLESQRSGGKLVLRRCLLQEAGSLLQQLHRANFYLGPAKGDPVDRVFAVVEDANGNWRVTLDRADLLNSQRHESIERGAARSASALANAIGTSVDTTRSFAVLARLWRYEAVLRRRPPQCLKKL